MSSCFRFAAMANGVYPSFAWSLIDALARASVTMTLSCLLSRDVERCRASPGCDERRARTDEKSNHAVVAMKRCLPAHRPPFVVLSVDVGAQLEEERRRGRASLQCG